MATTTQVRELFKLLTGWQRTSGLNREPLPEPAEVITVFAPFAGEGAIGELNDIPDVDTTGKSVGDVLKWNGTNWVADTDETGEDAIGELNDIPDVDTTGKSVGDVLKWDGTNWVADTDATGEAGTVALDDLTDVVITPGTLGDGQVLTYDGDTNTWVNEDAPSGSGATSLDELGDVAITTAAEGQILEKSATNWVNVTPKKRVVASFLMTGTDGGNLTLGNVSKDAAVGTIIGVRDSEGKYTITLPTANLMTGFAVAKLIPKMTIVSAANTAGDFKLPTITSMALSTNDLVVVMEVYHTAVLNSGDIVAGETLHVDIELIP